jgi:hypothetical protein
VQALAAPPEGDAGADGRLPVTLQGIYGAAAFGGAELDGPLRWDFGDGTTGESGSERRFVHPYAPGRYTVTVAARDTQGREARWSLPVRVHPRLRASITARNGRLSGHMSGGKRPALAWRWRLPDGRTAAGRTIRAPAATLTVTDATGTTASTTYGS